MQPNYCNEDRTMWKITLQDINTIPKKPKTQGHPTRNLWKRPKNNSKAWIKLSETILNILGDCWETFISSAPHSQQDWWKSSQPARCTYNPQPELLQKFSQQPYVVIGRHRAKFSPSVRGVGGGGGCGPLIWMIREFRNFPASYLCSRNTLLFWRVLSATCK